MLDGPMMFSFCFRSSVHEVKTSGRVGTSGIVVDRGLSTTIITKDCNLNLIVNICEKVLKQKKMFDTLI